MIKTLKKDRSLIVKVIVNQIGMDIFGLVLYLASTVAGHSNASAGSIMKIVTGVFSLLFYLVLLYTLSRDEGLKDQIRIESGKIKKNNFRFLKIALWANVWNFLLGVIVLVTKDVLPLILGEALPGIVGDIGGVAIIAILVTEGMYIGILESLFSMSGIACILIIIPAIAVLSFGYITGTKGGLMKLFSKKDKTTADKE